MRRVHVHVDEAVLERFDAQATARGLSRAGALRLLLNEGLPERDAGSLSEALALLTDSARAGSVQAQVAGAGAGRAGEAGGSREAPPRRAGGAQGAKGTGVSVLDLDADAVLDLLADAAERGERGAQRQLDLALEELEDDGDISVVTRLAATRHVRGDAA